MVKFISNTLEMSEKEKKGIKNQNNYLHMNNLHFKFNKLDKVEMRT